MRGPHASEGGQLSGPDSWVGRLGLDGPHVITGLLDELAEAVTIRDRAGEIVYANRPALSQMHLASAEDLRGQDGGEIMARFIVEDESGRPLALEDLPGVRAVSGKAPPEPMLMRVVERTTGEVLWRVLKTTVLSDRDGQFLGAMTVIEDVTAVKQAELRTRVLAESGRILASSLDYAETLRNIAEVAIPALGDYCGVDLLDDDGMLERVAAIHVDPAREEFATRLSELDRWLPPPGSPVGRVLRTGGSVLYPQISREELAAASRGEVHLQLGLDIGFRSLLFVPMRVPARTVGLLTLATAGSRRRLAGDDVQLAEQLGRRAAVAVENSRLHTKLSEVSRTLQQSLRPGQPPPIPGWEIASLYRPAQTDLRVDVGGDFYEFFPYDGTWFVIIGDVTGKGVGAAATTALMRHGARFVGRTEPHPSRILARLDEALAQQGESAMCTALCVAIAGDELIMSAGGHPPALLVAADGSIRQAPRAGPLLGAFPDGEWTDETVRLGEDELLLLYTDGVTEAPGPRGRFGVARLRALLAANAGAAPVEVLAQVEAALAAFRHGPERDDVAALALRRHQAVQRLSTTSTRSSSPVPAGSIESRSTSLENE
jgi:PAS domain S-box-containing protein